MNCHFLKTLMVSALSVSVSFILGACSTTSETFDCKAGSGVGCKSISEVNQMIDEQGRGKEAAGNKQSMLLPQHAESFPTPIISSTPPKIENLKTAPTSVPFSEYATVQRVPEEYLRVWIAPFQDEFGNLHEGSVIHTVLKSGSWQLKVPTQQTSDQTNIDFEETH